MPAIYLIAAIAALMSTQIAVDLTPRHDPLARVSHSEVLRVHTKKSAPSYASVEPSYQGNWFNAGRFE